MGPSVRRLYEQGREVNGAGINCSFAVHQDVDGRATDYALAWAVGLGSPYTFETTLESEYKSDIFGERGILLGAVHGIAESLYSRFVDNGEAKDDAFINSAESITGPISKTISRSGLTGRLRRARGAREGPRSGKAYNAAYHPCREDPRGDPTTTWRPATKCAASSRPPAATARTRWAKIDGTDMWKVGEKVRADSTRNYAPLHAETAGVYLACMMAQIDLLSERGHPYSEIANESIIEAVDSLNPYMDYKGVSFMVDNCSTTARLGAQQVGVALRLHPHAACLYRNRREPRRRRDAVRGVRQSSNIHEVLAVCAELRPSVDIAVVPTRARSSRPGCGSGRTAPVSRERRAHECQPPASQSDREFASAAVRQHRVRPNDREYPGRVPHGWLSTNARPLRTRSCDAGSHPSG